MKVGLSLHSLYFMGKQDRRDSTENTPVMYPATYYGYPTVPAYPINSGYSNDTIPHYSSDDRDIYNIGGSPSSKSKTSKTLDDIKKKVDSIDKTLKSIEEELKKKL